MIVRALHCGRAEVPTVRRRFFQLRSHPLVVVSVRDPDGAEWPDWGSAAMCRLSFYDTTDDQPPEDLADYPTMSTAEAMEVARWIVRWHAAPAPVVFVAQCEAGISRSAAIAEAAARYTEIRGMHAASACGGPTFPNHTVLRLVLAALERVRGGEPHAVA